MVLYPLMRVQVPCGCGARKRSRFHLVTAISLILLAGTWCWIRSLRISCEDSRGTTTGRTPRTGSVFMAHCTNRTKRLIPAKKSVIEVKQPESLEVRGNWECNVARVHVIFTLHGFRLFTSVFKRKLFSYYRKPN